MLNTKEPIMMTGSGGSKDYIMMGYKGRVALGVKFLGMAPPQQTGFYDQVVITWRVRAAWMDDDTYEMLMGDKEVEPKPEMEYPGDAFPDINWSRKDGTRCSVIFSRSAGPDFHIGKDQKLHGAVDIRSGKARSEVIALMSEALADGGTKVMTDDELYEALETLEREMLQQIWQGMLHGEVEKGNVKVEDLPMEDGVITDQNALAQKLKEKMAALDPELMAEKEQEPPQISGMG